MNYLLACHQLKIEFRACISPDRSKLERVVRSQWSIKVVHLRHTYASCSAVCVMAIRSEVKFAAKLRQTRHLVIRLLL